MKILIVCLAVLGSALSQESFKCPDDYGFYPHSISCDKYWKCEEGEAELKVCGNGLAFDDSDEDYLSENCDYLYNVKCGHRSEIEPPISIGPCVRLFGVFPDEEQCDVFYSCWNGEASRYKCSDGLAYDPHARVCRWADQVKTCKKEEIGNGFTCPADAISALGSFTRHAHPEDCRKYYVCLEKVPREYGCPLGTVFKILGDNLDGVCSTPEDVPGCEDYYGDLDVDEITKAQVSQGFSSGSRSSPSSSSSGNRRRIASSPSSSSKAQVSGPVSRVDPKQESKDDAEYEYEYVYEDEV